MGVIYKLKKEVIDLIVQKKKEDPALSCRKLKSILQATLGVDVSKSSINAVIKEYHLSNPIGRKARNPSKNFFIPQEKKEQLMAQVASFLPPGIIPEDKTDELIEENAVVEPLVLRPDPLKAVIMPDGQDVEKAGLFFLYAFMQDVFRSARMGELLAKAVGADMKLARALEASIFLNAFGVSSAEDLQRMALDALWQMFELDPSEGMRVLEDGIGKDSRMSSVFTALEVELDTALMPAGYLKCLADDGKSLCLTADMLSVFKSPEAVSRCGLFKAVQGAVDRFIVSTHPVIVDMMDVDIAAGQADVALLSGDGARLDKIELWAKNNGKAWEHIVSAGVQRKVAAIFSCPQEDGVGGRVQAAAEWQVCQDVDTQQEYRWALCVVEGVDQGSRWRCVMVEGNALAQKKLVLTNMGETADSMADVVQACLEIMRLSRPAAKGILSRAGSLGQDILVAGQRVFDVLREAMFSLAVGGGVAESAATGIFNCPGRIERRGRDIVVRLAVPPGGCAEEALLQSMLSFIGRGAWEDYDGRRYYFSVKN